MGVLRPNDGFHYDGGSKWPQGSSDGSMKSYVVAGGILTIPSNMTEQTRQDVLYAVLFAQLVADNSYNRNTQFQQWLNSIGEVGNYIGWSGSTFKNGNLTVNGSEFIPADSALQEMALHYRPSLGKVAATFKELFGILKKQSDSDKAIKLLAKYTYDPPTHDTTMMLCSVTESLPDHNPVFSILVISLSGVEDATGMPLFHLYKKKDIKAMMELFAIFSQDEELFAVVRKNVTDWLGDYVKTEISEIVL